MQAEPAHQTWPKSAYARAGFGMKRDIVTGAGREGDRHFVQYLDFGIVSGGEIEEDALGALT